INRAKPLEKDAPIVLFLGGVRAVGVRRKVDHVLVNLGRFVIASQNVEQETLVVTGLEVVWFLLYGFANGGERVFVLALAALDFADVNQRSGVIGIGVRKLLVFLHGRIELVIVQQSLRERAHGAYVAGLNIEGPLISSDRIFGTLHLVVCGPEREFHLAGAIGFRNCFDDFCGMVEIAAFGVKTGQVQDHVLGVGFHRLRGLELLFCLLRLVLYGIELTEDHAVFHVLRFERNDLFVFSDGLVKGIAARR